MNEKEAKEARDENSRELEIIGLSPEQEASLMQKYNLEQKPEQRVSVTPES